MKTYTWPDLLKFMLLLLAGGIALTEDRIIFLAGVIVSLVVWLVNVYHAKTGTYLGKFWTTLMLFGFCVLAIFVAKPAGVVIPTFPTWAGDPVAFITDLINFLKVLAQEQSGVFATAIVVYNVALSQILDKVAPRPALKPA